jgi:hypothetical protein
MAWALYHLIPYIREPKSYEGLPETSLHQMRHIMTGEVLPTRDTIIKGAYPADKITTSALESWKACDVRNVYITTYLDGPHWGE